MEQLVIEVLAGALALLLQGLLVKALRALTAQPAQ